MKTISQIIEAFEEKIDELIPLKTDFVVIHGYINLNRKDIKNLGTFIRTEIEGLIESCPERGSVKSYTLGMAIKEWKERVRG